MFQDCLTHEVVAALVTLVDRCQQEHHVLEQLVFARPLADVVKTFHNDLINYLARVPVDENHPLVDNKTLVLELNLNCLQHLNTAHNVV